MFFLTYCVACVIISINTSLRAGTGLVQSNIITAILFIMLIVGSLVYLKREQLHLKRENQNLIMQKKLVEAYNDVLMEQMILTRKLRHDIKNHLRTIEELNRQNAGNEAIYAVISEYAKLWTDNTKRLNLQFIAPTFWQILSLLQKYHNAGKRTSKY